MAVMLTSYGDNYSPPLSWEHAIFSLPNKALFDLRVQLMAMPADKLEQAIGDGEKAKAFLRVILGTDLYGELWECHYQDFENDMFKSQNKVFLDRLGDESSGDVIVKFWGLQITIFLGSGSGKGDWIEAVEVISIK